MKKRIKNKAISTLIFDAALIWFWGWLIFLVMEIIIRLIKGPSPWAPMVLFTLLLYGGVGIALGGVLGLVIGLLLKVVKRWQQRVKALPLIMSCCIAVIMLLYTYLFIHDRFLPFYSHLSRITLTLILLSALYMTLTRIIDRTRLIASYLALSTTLYAFVVAGLYINENLLTGNFFNPDYVRIITNLGIVISCIIIYVLTYLAFIFIGKKYKRAWMSTTFKILIVILIVWGVIGVASHFIEKRTALRKHIVKPGIQTDDKPNIILITMDTTRADHLSCYGYYRNTTPNLDKLARESVVFKNAYAPSPWTLPTHASLFTGMYPAKHTAHWDYERMKSNWPASLSKHHKTLAEILVDRGYRTAGVIGFLLCHSIFGLAQGFEYYDDALINVIPDLEHFTLFRILSRWVSLEDIAARQGLNGSRVASQINKLVFSWLEKHYQSPFFLFIHYFDPHHPYLPPDKYSLLFRKDENYEIAETERRKRDLLALYDGEIAYLDYHMGKLFEKLKKLKIYHKTMIFITSDHGEFFGEHDFWYHGHELYQEVLRIPLIIKYPSSYPKKGVYLKRVSLVDIMPTILNFLKLPLPKELQGVNLFDDSSGLMAEVYRHEYQFLNMFIQGYVKDERFLKGERFTRELKALFLDEYKYIREYSGESGGQEELYNIDSDPQELYNLIDTMPEKAKEMEMKLMEWLAYDESRISAPQPAKLDKATEEGLRALGYLQ